MLLAERVYHLTAAFPPEERFGIVAQMRRASVSIPSNIAEGQARHTTAEFVRFISYAEGSLAEVNTQLLLSKRLAFCMQEDLAALFDLADELKKMLNTLRRKLVTSRRR